MGRSQAKLELVTEGARPEPVDLLTARRGQGEAVVRVLLVEDEASVVTGVRRALEAEGYDVAVATDGRQGLGLLLDGGFDVAILDVLLPGMNGYELCRTARRQGVRAPIVMLTAKSGEWDVAEGLDLGADDYVTKPFSIVELLARIRARVRGPGGADGLEVGDLRLDPSARRCWRGDIEIELTGRETSLLAVLFRNAGQVVPKDELLESAWGPGHLGDPNVVEVYIGRLRRKLDAKCGADDIETVRGVGYRLRDRSPVQGGDR
jgi:two-component system OmpR family response regulator